MATESALSDLEPALVGQPASVAPSEQLKKEAVGTGHIDFLVLAAARRWLRWS